VEGLVRFFLDFLVIEFLLLIILLFLPLKERNELMSNKSPDEGDFGGGRFKVGTIGGPVKVGGDLSPDLLS
jgi:hypothetical protein